MNVLKYIFGIACLNSLDERSLDEIKSSEPRLISALEKYNRKKNTEEDLKLHTVLNRLLVFSVELGNSFVSLFTARNDTRTVNDATNALDIKKSFGIISIALESLLTLFIALESLIIFRRFSNFVFQESQILKTLVVPLGRSLDQAANNSTIYDNVEQRHINILVFLTRDLQHYLTIEFDSLSGSMIGIQDHRKLTNLKLKNFQKFIFTNIYCPLRDEHALPALKHFTTIPSSTLINHENFRKLLSSALKEFQSISKEDLSMVIEKYFSPFVPKHVALISNRTNSSSTANHSDQIAQLDDLIEHIYCRFESKQSFMQKIKDDQLSVYPNETIIWGTDFFDRIETEFNSDVARIDFPICHLGSQYLSFVDYLYKNFTMQQLIFAYDLRQDIVKSIRYMAPFRDENGKNIYKGWSRMCCRIQDFVITEIGEATVGQSGQPSLVHANLTINLQGLPAKIVKEWHDLRVSESLYLLQCQPVRSISQSTNSFAANNNNNDFTNQLISRSILAIRGCEIVGIYDDNMDLIDFSLAPELLQQNVKFQTGNCLVVKIALDPRQYFTDQRNKPTSCYEFYSESLNLVLRRPSEANNSKQILSTLKRMIKQTYHSNCESLLPNWLSDLITGYGNPNDSCYPAVTKKLLDISGAYAIRNEKIGWGDTFIDRLHLESSLKELYPSHKINYIDSGKIVGNNFYDSHLDVEIDTKYEDQILDIYLTKRKKIPTLVDCDLTRNTIRFNPRQISAIESAQRQGLSIIIGPPGSGKTDVAVQSILNLFRNYPKQKVAVITHSNDALNQIFMKLVHCGFPEEMLLRLGHGQTDLGTEKDFSKLGRVNYLLQQRRKLLARIHILYTHFDPTHCPSAEALTCELSHYFELQHILPRWQQFQDSTRQLEEINGVKLLEMYPFRHLLSHEDNIRVKEAHDIDSNAKDVLTDHYQTNIDSIFRKLEIIRPMEFLRRSDERSLYLMRHHTRVLAMTCTHSAMNYFHSGISSVKTNDENCGSLGSNNTLIGHYQKMLPGVFEYQSLLVEESGQMTEIENVIPMMTANATNTYLHGLQGDKPQQLQRVILIGDHKQLPPIVQSHYLSENCNAQQSLLARLVDVGTKYLQLNKQGRCRPELAQLFSWNYADLGNMPHTENNHEFIRANPGFLNIMQFIDVQDFNGAGETQPHPFFYQNLGEAEYLVAVYSFMRCIGYPADKIAVLTTYNGQKSLLSDIFSYRCASNPFLGMPKCISTVDKYQGQQADFVLLSLVRTKSLGYLGDVRRMIVAVSRARLGLYIFGRGQLFLPKSNISDSNLNKTRSNTIHNCFRPLLELPINELQLLPNEHYETCERLSKHNSGAQLPPPVDPLRIRSVEQMCDFSSQFLQSRLESL